jgi:hypothetical protein
MIRGAQQHAAQADAVTRYRKRYDLTRLHVDPWKEAAELSGLSKNTARERLASLIGRLPGGQWTPTDARTIAHRLIELLPQLEGSKVPSTEKASGIREMAGSPGAKMLICAALAAAALIIAASREPSRDNLADTPAVSTTPSQASPPNSR